MENVPIKQAFGALKWWTSLKPLDRVIALLAAVFMASAVINFYQYKEITRIQNEKNVVEKENLVYAKECEQRVAAVTIKERDKRDSMLAAITFKYENKFQRFFITRTRDVENSTEEIKTVLK